MKDGVEAHVNGILRTTDWFEQYTGDKPVLTADIRQANGMIYIFQRAKDDSNVTRMMINKDNVLFIDFENESQEERRPLVTVSRRD